VLLHLLLILQRLKRRKLPLILLELLLVVFARLWCGVRRLHHHLPLHLLHLLLSNDDSFVSRNARHIDHVRLELA